MKPTFQRWVLKLSVIGKDALGWRACAIDTGGRRPAFDGRFLLVIRRSLHELPAVFAYGHPVGSRRKKLVQGLNTFLNVEGGTALRASFADLLSSREGTRDGECPGEAGDGA